MPDLDAIKMLSNRPTKSQLRVDHQQKVDEFLSHGGKVQHVCPGATGLIDGKYNTRHIRLGGPPKPRTPIPEVIAAIENRRCSKKTATKPRSKTSTRHRKVIYDDFGEPIRSVWVNK